MLLLRLSDDYLHLVLRNPSDRLEGAKLKNKHKLDAFDHVADNQWDVMERLARHRRRRSRSVWLTTVLRFGRLNRRLLPAIVQGPEWGNGCKERSRRSRDRGRS